MNNLYGYYINFKTTVLKSVLKTHIKELEDVGNGSYHLSRDRVLNVMKRVEVIRVILKERASKWKLLDLIT